jgi:adenylate cyclase
VADGTEIERKFLVAELPPGLDEAPATRIEQGYVAVDDDGTEVRIRRRGEETVLTIKSGSGRARTEEEFAIDAARFARLWPLTEGRRIEKTRHVIGTAPAIELDLYDGALEGLRVAEVEFPDDAAADAFLAPAWFGPEVTDDARYKNRALARDGAPADP